MDREKLNKASVDYSRSLHACGMYEKETPATPEDIAFAFIAGSNYVMGLPLTERLSEEEKKSLCELYACYKQHEAVSKEKGLYEAEMIARGSTATMRDIFGKEMFENIE